MPLSRCHKTRSHCYLIDKESLVFIQSNFKQLCTKKNFLIVAHMATIWQVRHAFRHLHDTDICLLQYIVPGAVSQNSSSAWNGTWSVGCITRGLLWVWPESFKTHLMFSFDLHFDSNFDFVDFRPEFIIHVPACRDCRQLEFATSATIFLEGLATKLFLRTFTACRESAWHLTIQKFAIQ